MPRKAFTQTTDQRNEDSTNHNWTSLSQSCERERVGLGCSSWITSHRSVVRVSSAFRELYPTNNSLESPWNGQVPARCKTERKRRDSVSKRKWASSEGDYLKKANAFIGPFLSTVSLVANAFGRGAIKRDGVPFDSVPAYGLENTVKRLTKSTEHGPKRERKYGTEGEGEKGWRREGEFLESGRTNTRRNSRGPKRERTMRIEGRRWAGMLFLVQQ